MLTFDTSQRHGSFQRTLRLTIGLIGFMMLSTGCPKRIVLPDTSQVHQLSRDVDAEVWCHGPEAGTWTKCQIRAAKGWWLAPPSVVEKPSQQ